MFVPVLLYWKGINNEYKVYQVVTDAQDYECLDY